MSGTSRRWSGIVDVPAAERRAWQSWRPGQRRPRVSWWRRWLRRLGT